MRKFRFFACVISVFFVLTVSLTIIVAATKAEGYTVLRDGATFITGVSGIMNGTTVYSYNPIVYRKSGNVSYTTFDNFLQGKEFLGYYYPERNINNAAINATHLSNIRALARDLVSEEIGGSSYYAVNYNTATTGTKVQPENITGISTAGVIEYVYEYYNFKITGTNDLWNVTSNSKYTKKAHKVTVVTCKYQAFFTMKNCLGDINYSRSVNTTDAQICLQYAAHTYNGTFDSYQEFVADVNGDGNVNAADARLILQYSAHTLENYPYFEGDPVLDYLDDIEDFYTAILTWFTEVWQEMINGI